MTTRSGLLSNAYRCAQLNPLSSTQVQALIQDVNSKEAYFVEINYGISTYPVGALRFYSLSLFTPGQNTVISGYFSSSTLFYYVGSAKSIT